MCCLRLVPQQYPFTLFLLRKKGTLIIKGLLGNLVRVETPPALFAGLLSPFGSFKAPEEPFGLIFCGTGMFELRV